MLVSQGLRIVRLSSYIQCARNGCRRVLCAALLDVTRRSVAELGGDRRHAIRVEMEDTWSTWRIRTGQETHPTVGFGLTLIAAVVELLGVSFEG